MINLLLLASVLTLPVFSKPPEVLSVDDITVDLQKDVEKAAKAAQASLETATNAAPDSPARKEALAHAEASKDTIVKIAEEHPKNVVATQTAQEGRRVHGGIVDQ